MAIIFSEKRKKQQYFILVFVVVVILTSMVVWFGIFKKPNPQSVLSTRPIKRVEIDFGIFNKEILSNLELFKEIPFLEEAAGRENPFLPKPAP